MSRPSISTPTPEQERPWLQAYYAAKRQRTVTLVKAAVDRLRQEGQVVTIEAICHLSRELDPQGKGIQKAGVLGNAEAYAYYRQHSVSYQTAHKRKARRPRRAPVLGRSQPYRIDAERDVEQVRRRYLQTTKAELVERLLDVEQVYARMQQQLARVQFELLGLQAKQAETVRPGSTPHSQERPSR